MRGRTCILIRPQLKHHFSIPLGLALWITATGWVWSSLAHADDSSAERKLVEALSDPRDKLRLQAAILIGKHKFIGSAPYLRQALNDKSDSVIAAAAVSLGKLGDQEARGLVAKLLRHANKLVNQAGEKSLILLDQAKGRPRYFIAIGNPRLAKGIAPSRANRLIRVFRSKLDTSPDIVLSAGEENILSGRSLSQHLKRRKIFGMLLEPKLVRLDKRVSASSTTVRCKVSVMTLTLINKQLEHNDSGSADAQVSARSIPASQLKEIENQILDASTQAGAEAVMNYLRRRQGP